MLVRIFKRIFIFVPIFYQLIFLFVLYNGETPLRLFAILTHLFKLFQLWLVYFLPLEFVFKSIQLVFNQIEYVRFGKPIKTSRFNWIRSTFTSCLRIFLHVSLLIERNYFYWLFLTFARFCTWFFTFQILNESLFKEVLRRVSIV